MKVKKLYYYLYIVYTLEIGLILFLTPWLNMWESNYFFQKNLYIGEIVRNPFFRGAISGLGLVTILIAFGESIYTDSSA